MLHCGSIPIFSVSAHLSDLGVWPFTCLLLYRFTKSFCSLAGMEADIICHFIHLGLPMWELSGHQLNG